MSSNTLPCSVYVNQDGSVSLLNMTPKFADHLLGFAIAGASEEEKAVGCPVATAQLEGYNALCDMISGSMDRLCE